MSKARWIRVSGIMLSVCSAALYADGYRFPIPGIVLGIGAWLATWEAPDAK